MMRKTIFFTAMLAAVLNFNSCTTSPICVTSSVTPLEGKQIGQNLGKAEGADTAFSVLGLYMIGRPDLDLAIKSAVQSRGGDTLINVSCYETYVWFLLGSMTTVKVEGEAVKFTAEADQSADVKNDSKKGRKK